MKKNLNTTLLAISIFLLFGNIIITAIPYLPFGNNIKSLNSTQNSLIATENEVKTLINKNFLGEQITEQDFAIGRLKGEVTALKDDYSEYQTASDQAKFSSDLNQNYKGIGIMVEKKDGVILIVKVFNDSPAFQSGLVKGDIITKVGDVSIISQKDPKLEEIVSMIRGEEGTSVKLEIARGGETKQLSVLRKAIKGELITLEVRGNTAVIRIDSFGEGLNDKMNMIANSILANTAITKISIDLRSNTGGLLNEAVDVISYFVPTDSVIVKEKRKIASVDEKEKQIAKAGGNYQELEGNAIIATKSDLKANSLAKYPVSIVVDSFSASASEIVAGSLKDIRGAKLYGQNTFGKGVVQQIFELKNGDYLKLTIAQWITPSGTEINKKGLKPDVELDFKVDALEEAIKGS